MHTQINCSMCDEPIEDLESYNHEIRRCAEVNGDLCPKMQYGFYHTHWLPKDEEPAEEE